MNGSTEFGCRSFLMEIMEFQGISTWPMEKNVEKTRWNNHEKKHTHNTNKKKQKKIN